MGSRTKLLFHFFWPWSNTAHHLISHIYGKKNDDKFLHQKDHILVIKLIVKKDIRQRINVHLMIVVTTKDLEAEEICFFACFSAFLCLDGNFLVIRLIVKKDFGKRKNAILEKERMPRLLARSKISGFRPGTRVPTWVSLINLVFGFRFWFRIPICVPGSNLGPGYQFEFQVSTWVAGSHFGPKY